MINSELILPFIFITLIVVIIIQAVERYFMADQFEKKQDKLLEEQSRLIKAIISKNANDYVMTASIDKVAPEEKAPVNTDLIPEDELSDDEFMTTIKGRVKK